MTSTLFVILLVAGSAAFLAFGWLCCALYQEHRQDVINREIHRDWQRPKQLDALARMQRRARL